MKKACRGYWHAGGGNGLERHKKHAKNSCACGDSGIKGDAGCSDTLCVRGRTGVTKPKSFWWRDSFVICLVAVLDRHGIRRETRLVVEPRAGDYKTRKISLSNIKTSSSTAAR